MADRIESRSGGGAGLRMNFNKVQDELLEHRSDENLQLFVECFLAHRNALPCPGP